MSDNAIASKLARISKRKQGNHIDRCAKAEYLKHPNLIEIKRAQLQLNRTIKEIKK